MVAKIAIHIEESEARLQRCCGPEGCGAHNERPYPGRWCVGEECMAWRWFETNVKNRMLPQPLAGLGPEDLTPSGEVFGYCGLAGSPRPAREA